MIQVRPLVKADEAAVYALVAAAFGQSEEADLVDRLRSDGACAAEFVAEDHGLVGHVMLSNMKAPFRALALAPVSVAPPNQRQGVGSALVQAAVAWAEKAGYQAIFVLGDEDYYARFGFDVEAAKGFTSPFEGPHFALLSFSPRAVLTDGDVEHAAAFFN